MGSQATGTQDAVGRYRVRAFCLHVGRRGYKLARVLAQESMLLSQVNIWNDLHGEDTLLGWAC